jgi:hypothetical protein
MPLSDFLNVDLAAQAEDLAGEIHKVYQRTNLSGKNEAVDRLRRQVNALAAKVREAQEARTADRTRRLLEEAGRLLHECVPLMDLCLRRVLLSPELHRRWTGWLSRLEEGLRNWSGEGPS